MNIHPANNHAIPHSISTDKAVSKEAYDRLVNLLQTNKKPILRLAFFDGAGGLSDATDICATTLSHLIDVLRLQSQGFNLSVIAESPTVSTQVAADTLGVSRTFVVKEIEHGKIQCIRIGSKRRIHLDEINRYHRDIMMAPKA